MNGWITVLAISMACRYKKLAEQVKSPGIQTNLLVDAGGTSLVRALVGCTRRWGLRACVTL